MSNKAINWAYNQVRGIGLAAKAVLVKLADQASDEGVAWCGKETIAEQLDCDKRTVDRAIDKLEGLGLLKIKSGVPKQARSKVERNIYYLQLDQLGLFGLEVVGERRPDLEQKAAKGVAERHGWQGAMGGTAPGEGVAESHKRGGTLPSEPLKNPPKNPKTVGPADAGPEFYLSAKGKKLSGVVLRRFEEFWAFWGRYGNKAPTADAWLAVEKYYQGAAPGWESAIIHAARAEAARREREPDQSAKMAQGWLSERRWEDHQAANHKPMAKGTAWYENWSMIALVAGEKYGILNFDYPEPPRLLAELIQRMETAQDEVPDNLRKWLKSMQEAA